LPSLLVTLICGSNTLYISKTRFSNPLKTDITKTRAIVPIAIPN
jgi:hypothetical protein